MRKNVLLLMTLFYLIGINIFLYSEDNIKEESYSPDDIIFSGRENHKKRAVKLLDKALRKQGDLGAYGDLSGGLADVMTEMYVKISEEGNSYFIEIYPKSNAGHDFSFSIGKITGKMSDVAIGEIMPLEDLDLSPQ